MGHSPPSWGRCCCWAGKGRKSGAGACSPPTASTRTSNLSSARRLFVTECAVAHCLLEGRGVPASRGLTSGSKAGGEAVGQGQEHRDEAGPPLSRGELPGASVPLGLSSPAPSGQGELPPDGPILMLQEGAGPGPKCQLGAGLGLSSDAGRSRLLQRGFPSRHWPEVAEPSPDGQCCAMILLCLSFPIVKQQQGRSSAGDRGRARSLSPRACGDPRLREAPKGTLCPFLGGTWTSSQAQGDLHPGPQHQPGCCSCQHLQYAELKIAVGLGLGFFWLALSIINTQTPEPAMPCLSRRPSQHCKLLCAN